MVFVCAFFILFDARLVLRILCQMDSIEDLKNYFDKKIEELAARNFPPHEVQPTIAAIPPVIFKSKGNQHQYDHQQKTLDLIEKAQACIARKKLEEADSFLLEAKDAINKRIKLIKIADKSEGGWQTVLEYMSDEVASDTDDEKRIRRANTAALQKRKKKSAEYKAKRMRSSGSRQSVRWRPQNSIPSTSGYTPSPHTFRRAPGTADICFACGLSGHWRKACPNTNGGGRSYAGAGSRN